MLLEEYPSCSHLGFARLIVTTSRTRCIISSSVAVPVAIIEEVKDRINNDCGVGDVRRWHVVRSMKIVQALQ